MPSPLPWYLDSAAALPPACSARAWRPGAPRRDAAAMTLPGTSPNVVLSSYHSRGRTTACLKPPPPLSSSRAKSASDACPGTCRRAGIWPRRISHCLASAPNRLNWAPAGRKEDSDRPGGLCWAGWSLSRILLLARACQHRLAPFGEPARRAGERGAASVWEGGAPPARLPRSPQHRDGEVWGTRQGGPGTPPPARLPVQADAVACSPPAALEALQPAGSACWIDRLPPPRPSSWRRRRLLPLAAPPTA